MRASEVRYRRLFEAAHDGVLLLDPHTYKIIDANPFLTRLPGYSREEFVGKELWQIGLLQDADASRAAFHRLAREGYIRYEDLPLQARTGELREVEFVSNVYDEGGRPMIQCTIRDSTERKRAEAELRLQSTALRSAANAIVITDPQGAIQWVNPAFEHLTGYTAAQALGQKPRLLKSGRHDQAFFKNMWDTVLAGQVWQGELTNKRKDGTEYTEQMTITPVRDPAGKLTQFVAIKQDVTDLVRAREVLARSKGELERLVQERTAELQEAMAELEQMSHSMIHDMRAPLRAMQSFAGMLQEECPDCQKPPGLHYLHRIRESSNRLDRLITDALNYNKVVRENLPVVPVEVGRLLRGMIDTYPNLHPSAADISFEFRDLVVLGNESLLTQVFGNLLGNAVRFVAPGVRPRIRVWAQPSTLNSQLSTRIYVQDNGIGIPQDAQHKIFGMFQRMHSQRDYPGTGIGLTIVKKAVERMRGRVGLESEPGKGSRFWVEFLRVTEAEGSLPLEAAA